MEQQMSIQPEQVPIQGDKCLISLITSTYKARSQGEVRDAELRLISSFAMPGFIDKIFGFLDSQENFEPGLKKAIANLIKKFSYDFSKRSGDKAEFIHKLFGLILDDRLELAARQLLGVALQHQFNSDQEGVYKNTVIERALGLLNGQESVKYLEGVLIVALAYLNSLVQMKNQIDFFTSSLDSLCRASALFYDFVTKMPQEEWVVVQKKYIPIVNKLVNYLQTAIERIVDEEDFFREEVQALRTNTFFVQLLELYALLFHTNHSVVSRSCPSINPAKSILLNVVKWLYIEHQCPIKLFQIIFLTFLFECKSIVEDAEQESILVLCLQILEDHLKRKTYYRIYLDHKIQTIFALFMYSATTPQQFHYINDQPEKFVEISEEYSEAYAKSPYIKVKASCFLQVYIETMDESTRNLVQILMIILTGTLDISSEDSAMMSAVKAEFSRFDFFGLSSEQRLETALLILSSIAPHISRREDLLKVIQAFLITQYEPLTKIQSPLIVLRLIRVVSYYPISLYFTHIRAQMARGRAFVLEGLKAFERILKVCRHPAILPLITAIFIELMGVIHINDSIFQLLILNNYDRLLRNNDQLYGLCLSRIKQEFQRNLTNNQHNTLLCFNLINGMLRKQSSPVYLVRIQKIYYEIIKNFEKAEFKSYAKTYSEKILEINIIIISKYISIHPQIEEWGLITLRQADNHYKGSIIFKFYNQLLMKLDNAWFKVQPYFKAFLEEVRRRVLLTGDNDEHLEVLPYYFYLLGQIAASFNNVALGSKDVFGLLEYTAKLPDRFKQFPLSFLLCCLYVKPLPLLKILKESNIYESTLRIIVSIKFQGKIFRKILLLAFIKLLQIEDNILYFKQILTHCVNYLKVQFKRNFKESLRVTSYEVRPRRYDEDKTRPKEEAMEVQQEDDNQLVNLFINFKHPFQILSEFDQFKVIFWQNQNNLDNLDELMRNDIRQLLRTEWVSSKTRVIKRIKPQP